MRRKAENCHSYSINLFQTNIPFNHFIDCSSVQVLACCYDQRLFLPEYDVRTYLVGEYTQKRLADVYSNSVLEDGSQKKWI